MKGQKQKISKDNCQQKAGAEHRGYVGAPTFVWITENNEVTPPQEDGILGKILNPYNLNKAYLKVVRNKGSHGVDKMEVGVLHDYLQQHGSDLIKSIKSGKYHPNPVRRVEIPKDKTSKHPLGIPTVVDRFVQQAIHQVLSPIYERQFSDNSYGFRPKRSTHKALQRCKEYISEGYEYAVDMDMEKFFDTVNHSKLIEILSKTVEDSRVISLIHKYLNAGVVVGHKFETTEQGVPQGGPLSPLLSNIMLNELDKELTLRGHRFIRYADDMVILCKSRRGAERVKESITYFIENKLFLIVNKEKTQVVYLSEIKFLGYSFYKKHGEVRFRIHPKSILKLRDKIRFLTSRSNGWGYSDRKEKLSAFIKGWVNYFRYADIKKLLIRIDEWYRRRLRMVIWKQWKRIRTRYKNLFKLGIPKSKAWEWANTRKAYWRVAKSFILSRSITNENLSKAGYLFFTDYYLKVRVD
ncbi:MAG: group II intron reverse transcriptase/maturase [Bacteroidales bacterium]|nr:group II intron reverse transcriptase/maturase [Bacteroidales bacterium]